MFQRLRLSTAPLPQGNAIIISGLFFHEVISLTQWIGMLLIVAGIVLIQR